METRVRDQRVTQRRISVSDVTRAKKEKENARERERERESAAAAGTIEKRRSHATPASSRERRMGGSQAWQVAVSPKVLIQLGRPTL